MADLDKAVYQSLLHLGWIDKLLDNISTIFLDLYKDQLKSTRARIVEYPFDRYFDQQVKELENISGAITSEGFVADAEEKKDPLVSSDNGGPPPPSMPGLLRGMSCLLRERKPADIYQRSIKLRQACRPPMRVRHPRPRILLDHPRPPQAIF